MVCRTGQRKVRLRQASHLDRRRLAVHRSPTVILGLGNARQLSVSTPLRIRDRLFPCLQRVAESASDADKVILEYSFDLVQWLPSGERTRAMDHYFHTGDTQFTPSSTSRFFRLLRSP